MTSIKQALNSAIHGNDLILPTADKAAFWKEVAAAQKYWVNGVITTNEKKSMIRESLRFFNSQGGDITT